jgi:pyruvate formate lyase activating enzyme
LAESASPERLAQAALELGCRSVAFTYNDPIVFLEYAVDVAKACHKLDIKTVAVTAGYIKAEARKEFFSHMDAANVDLKGFSEGFYKKLCSADLSSVLDTLKYIKEQTDVWLEITTLLIPGENDSDDELLKMTDWIADNLGPDVPLHFSAFHPDYRMRDKKYTPLETLLRAREIALAAGLNYVFTGNIRDESSASTYCAACGHELIVRSGYDLLRYNLDATGCCPKCGSKCAGVFEATPGKWGNRRRAVSF